MNTQWKPKSWVSLLVGIVLQPFVFLYVNRPRLFWLYLLALFFATGIDYFTHQNLSENSWYHYFYFSWLFILICPIHAYFLTKNYDPGEKRGWYSRWWAIPSILLAFYIPIFLVRAFMYEPFSIPASSMSPNINKGDYVIVKKWGYGGYESYGLSIINSEISEPSRVRRSGLYVFYPPNSDSLFIKRVIGMPGDTVEIDGQEISVNGKSLTTKYVETKDGYNLYQETYNDDSYLIQRNPNRPYKVTNRFQIPEKHYFFLGDNRDNSSDSRIWGPVPNSSFIGEIVYVF